MATAVRRSNYDPYRNLSYSAYDGSAARVLDREEVLRPEHRTRQRQQELVRPRVEARPAGKVSLFAVAGFAATAVLAVFILLSYVQLATVSAEVVSLNNDLTRLQSEEAVLRTKYELAYDVGTIESTVTADGSMGRPQVGQMVYVDMTEPDSVVVYEQEQETSGGLLETVRGMIDNILAYF